jgi:hypothetical protein
MLQANNELVNKFRITTWHPEKSEGENNWNTHGVIYVGVIADSPPGHACLAAHRLWAPKEVQQDCSLMPHIDLQVGIQPAGWGEGGGVMVVAVRADATLALNSPWLLRLVGLIGVASLR